MQARLINQGPGAWTGPVLVKPPEGVRWDRGCRIPWTQPSGLWDGLSVPSGCSCGNPFGGVPRARNRWAEDFIDWKSRWISAEPWAPGRQEG